MKEKERKRKSPPTLFIKDNNRETFLNPPPRYFENQRLGSSLRREKL